MKIKKRQTMNDDEVILMVNCIDTYIRMSICETKVKKLINLTIESKLAVYE